MSRLLSTQMFVLYSSQLCYLNTCCVIFCRLIPFHVMVDYENLCVHVFLDTGGLQSVNKCRTCYGKQETFFFELLFIAKRALSCTYSVKTFAIRSMLRLSTCAWQINIQLVTYSFFHQLLVNGDVNSNLDKLWWSQSWIKPVLGSVAMSISIKGFRCHCNCY